MAFGVSSHDCTVTVYIIYHGIVLVISGLHRLLVEDVASSQVVNQVVWQIPAFLIKRSCLSAVPILDWVLVWS